MTNKISRFCLGTAQIGMNYGANNIYGKPDFSEAKKIIDLAIKSGINTFDTAPEYGDSEIVMGKVVRGRPVIYISKVYPSDLIPAEKDKIKYIDHILEKTISDLKIKRLPIYLFHRIEDVLQNRKVLLKHMVLMKTKGLIEHIGASVDTPKEAEMLLEVPEIEVIEVSFSAVDRRLLENKFLKKARDKGLIILARSIYLKGLLLNDQLPNWAHTLSPVIIQLKKLAKGKQMPFKELLIRYVLSNKMIDSLIVGQEKHEQLKENISFWNKGPLDDKLVEMVDCLPIPSNIVLTPKLWPKT